MKPFTVHSTFRLAGFMNASSIAGVSGASRSERPRPDEELPLLNVCECRRKRE
jgi:hypothetical protein